MKLVMISVVLIFLIAVYFIDKKGEEKMKGKLFEALINIIMVLAVVLVIVSAIATPFLLASENVPEWIKLWLIFGGK